MLSFHDYWGAYLVVGLIAGMILFRIMIEGWVVFRRWQAGRFLDSLCYESRKFLLEVGKRIGLLYSNGQLVLYSNRSDPDFTPRKYPARALANFVCSVLTVPDLHELNIEVAVFFLVHAPKRYRKVFFRELRNASHQEIVDELRSAFDVAFSARQTQISEDKRDARLERAVKRLCPKDRTEI